MAYPTSVHQLKIPEPYLICLAQDCRTDNVPLSFFLSSSLPDIHRGQRTFPDMHLQRCPFLILLSHPNWAVYFTLLTLMEFMMFFFTFLWKQGLFRPLSSFYPPPSLFLSFCSRCRLYHLNPRFTQKLKDIGVKLEVLRGYLICLFIAYFEKNFIIKKLNPLIRHILLKLLAT